MTARGRVLAVGEAISAFMHYADDPPLLFYGPFPSGAPVIFASAAARLGAHVELATAVGADVFGGQFRERPAAHGVSAAGTIVDERHPTASAFVSYEADGSRSYVFYLKGTAALSVGLEVLDRIGPVDWLHVSGATLTFGGMTAETAWEAVERAVAAGTRISFDPNVRAGDLSPETERRFARLLEVAAAIFVSAGELAALHGSEERILARGGTVCHKAGAAGAAVLVGRERWRVPAPAVTEVDPDGAGDIFAAGFVAATLAGAAPSESAEVAVRVASASVAVRGPLASRIEPLQTSLGSIA